MAARTLKPRHQDDIRAKIQASSIINRLRAGFDGEVELTPTQVSIGMCLLKKVLPDLSAVDISGETKTQLTFVVDATLRDL